MGLLTKIFGNRDDPDGAGGEGSEDGTLERETIEIEPFRLTRDPVRYSASDAGSDAASEQSGPLPIAAPEAEVAAAENAGRTSGVTRRKQRRSSRNGGNSGNASGGGDGHRPHELTRRRIARPTVSTDDVPPTPPPIPDVAPDATARPPEVKARRSEVKAAAPEPKAAAPEADDPEEIDVSDQLDEVSEDGDLDASEHLIIEDDEALEDDEDEETNTSVAIWGAAAGSSPAAASSPLAAPPPSSASSASSSPATSSPPPSTVSSTSREPVAPSLGSLEPEPSAARPADVATDSIGSMSPDTSQPAPEWTRMATDTKTPKQTLVEAGTEFTGTLKSSCPVVVNGTLDGDIDAPTLSIASSGAIKGTIRAKTLRSHGTLAGTIDATEVFVSGAVKSKTVIRAKRLEVKIGSSEKGDLQVTFGKCDLELSEMPLESESFGSRSSYSSGGETGNAGWDLPEAESRVTPARASGGVERARSK
ncbi:MAG TPA: polymer-forming cytoskeletal protein [Polyangiaceae bacterium]|nr:polymer-forming cytoskeletal protein [Polyangiaceae bacterium]